MSHQTLPQQLIEVLPQTGGERIYVVVGDSLKSVVDAIRRTDGIDWVQASCEEAGAFAAAAEPQLMCGAGRNRRRRVAPGGSATPRA
jgi:pyruvate dehydrogenase (quinone)